MLADLLTSCSHPVLRIPGNRRWMSHAFEREAGWQVYTVEIMARSDDLLIATDQM